MTNNVLVLREAYRLFTDTKFEPSLSKDAPVPQKGYFFSFLPYDIRAELKIGKPHMSDCGRSARMQVFRPGDGPNAWPGEMLAVCEVVDTDLSEAEMTLNLYPGEAGLSSARSQLCTLMAERFQAAAIQAGENIGSRVRVLTV